MSDNPTVRPVEILLVEDSPVDVMLTREALLEAKIINNLHVVEDGEQALAYLRNVPPYENAVRPDLMLLDLNLPRLSGHEVLREIKSDMGLRTIPVVILSTSSASDDVRFAYSQHANCYIAKPADLDSLINIVRSIEQFWLCVVTLPQVGVSPA